MASRLVRRKKKKTIVNGNSLRLLLRIGVCFGVLVAVKGGDRASRTQLPTPEVETITDIVTETVTSLVPVTKSRGQRLPEDDCATATPSRWDKPTTGERVTLPPPAWKWKFSMTVWDILQVLCSGVGFLGNLLVVLVTALHQANTNSTDILTTALAVADLLTSLFFIPIPVAARIPDTILGNVYCKLVSDLYPRLVCVIASTYTLVVMSFERLVAVVYPLHFKAVFTKRRTYTFLLATWVGSFSSCSYFFTTRSNGTVCVDDLTRSSAQALSASMITLRLLIPVFLMTVSQIIVVVSLHRQSKRFSQMSSDMRKFRLNAARNRVVKMTFIVVATFIVSWAPAQVTWLGFALNLTSGGPSKREQFKKMFGRIAFINSLANPIIYMVYYPKFRRAAAQFLSRRVTEKKVPLFGLQEKKCSPNNA